MANEVGEKELWTEWPMKSGLEADERHHGRQINLTAEGIDGLKSTVPARDRVGI